MCMQVRDQYGNAVLNGGHAIASTFKVSTASESETMTIVDNSDGTYTASYALSQGGVYSITVTLDGLSIQGR